MVYSKSYRNCQLCWMIHQIRHTKEALLAWKRPSNSRFCEKKCPGSKPELTCPKTSYSPSHILFLNLLSCSIDKSLLNHLGPLKQRIVWFAGNKLKFWILQAASTFFRIILHFPNNVSKTLGEILVELRAMR